MYKDNKNEKMKRKLRPKIQPKEGFLSSHRHSTETTGT
jgi:hypothetical protein